MKSYKLLAAGAAFCLWAGCRRPPAVTHDRSASAVSQHRDEPAAHNSPGAQFRDIISESGIRYQWLFDETQGFSPVASMGKGCAFLDYDNDGNLDILLIGPKLALYKGDGHGHFKDVTHETGLDKLHGEFLGCAVGDYDNDGYEDIYVSGYRCGALLHNEKGKFFRDVTKQMGIKPQPFGNTCAFGEVAGSGRLDLYICNYLDYDKPLTYMGADPRAYPPEYGVLLQNEGARFRDVSKAWNVGEGVIHGKQMGVVIADFDGSGRQSIALADDTTESDLLLNRKGKFKNIGEAAGIAFNRDGNTFSGMAFDCGDYANDGHLDMFMTAFAGDTKSLLHNNGHAQFTDMSPRLGIEAWTKRYVAWGAKFIDYDNDGWLDIIIANGHTTHNLVEFHANTETFKQPTQLLHNLGGKAFEDVSETSGPDLTRQILGRGLAIGDFDNDGRMDVLIVDSDGKPLLLHNETPNVGHWLLCKLIGTKSNRDGIGALLTFETPDGRKMLRRCSTDGSYLSASDKRVHCGLGKATSASITVKWPSGHVDRYRNISADRVITLKEGDNAVR